MKFGSIDPMPSAEIKRLQAHGEECFAIFETNGLSYISPPLRSPEHVATFAIEHRLCEIKTAVEDCMHYCSQAKTVLTVNEEKLSHVKTAIKSLKAGNVLSEDDALALFELYSFARDQFHHELDLPEEIDEPAIDRWIETLDLRSEDDEDVSAAEILSHAVSKSFLTVGERKMYGMDPKVEHSWIPNENEMQLVVRYLETMFPIAERAMREKCKEVGEGSVPFSFNPLKRTKKR